MRQLPQRCNKSTEIANSWSYKDFTDSFINYHTEGEPTGYFSRHQMESMLQEINSTYRPGEYDVHNGTWHEEPDRTAVCWSHNSTVSKK